ncbi:PepSY domain-containing protein [Thermoflavimicrobium dichotomicum]
MAKPTQNHSSDQKHEQEKANPLYAAIWRWHFYAGLIFAPFLVMLAVTGGIYLFKPQIESWLYKDMYQVQAEGKELAPSEQIEKIKKRIRMLKYPGTNLMLKRTGPPKWGFGLGISP